MALITEGNLIAKTYEAASPTRARVRSMIGAVQRVNWRSAMIARGFGWNVTVGSLSTGIVGGGDGDVPDQDQPEFGISIPAGVTCVPFDFLINVCIGIVAADSEATEAFISVDRIAAWDGTGTFTIETPRNLRTNGTAGCPCRCFSAATANITNPTLSFDLARKEALADVQDAATPATVNVTQFDLHYKPINPLFIVGPACIYGYWGGTVACTGYATLNFITFPSALITHLA